MSGFYDELDRRLTEARINRLLQNRSDNVHDYQGCARDHEIEAALVRIELAQTADNTTKACLEARLEKLGEL